MEFKYHYENKPSDLWQLHMYYTYSSYTCIINIVCIVSSIALIYSIWATSPTWLRILLLLFLSLFTVIQPLGVYRRVKRNLEGNAQEIDLVFSEAGVHVTVGDKSEFKNWGQLRGMVIKPTVIAIYADQTHGYVLSNRILKDTRKDFVAFLKERSRNANRR